MVRFFFKKKKIILEYIDVEIVKVAEVAKGLSYCQFDSLIFLFLFLI